MIRNPIDEKFDIIILAGQSNAESSGLGPAYKDEWQVQNKIYTLKGDYTSTVAKKAYGNEYLNINPSTEYYIEQTKERLYDGKVYGVFANYFAEMYKNNDLKDDRKILIVHTAVGGTGFAKWHWGLNDPLYKRMLNMTKEALEMNSENRVVAILWHQGEHDAYEPPEMADEDRKQTYKKNLSAFIDGVRDAFGSDLPFVCAGFSRFWVKDYPNQCAAVLGATKEVCEIKLNAAFIEKTDDLEVNDEAVANGDTVHFSRKALYVLAERYYDAYKKITYRKEK